MPALTQPVDAMPGLLERLSRQSVEKHFDAYADIDWDSAEHRIDDADPRWELWSFDPLGDTDWYRSQSSEMRACIGLHRVAAAMRIGWEFENVLQRGLLAYAYRLPNGRPEFRYIHHEVVEESQHTMMFQEFVNRTGLRVRGMPPLFKLVGEWFVIPMNRWFPELFFLFVLGGEDPVDHLQRLQLKNDDVHPLVQRIMRIHVTEEARHLSFARQYLKVHVPELGWARRQVLAVAAPLLFGTMARIMLYPPVSLLRKYGVPPETARRAARSESGRRLLRDAVAKPRRLCTELGLVNAFTRPLWRALKIWE